ncbi:MAG: hypothetical protein RLZZ479_182, partial [Bacteroidota bacterium]
MNTKIKGSIVVVLIAFVAWYFLLKPSDYTIRFEAKTATGTIYQGVQDWAAAKTKSNTESYTTVEKRNYDFIKQELKKGDEHIVYTWTLTSVNDFGVLMVVWRCFQLLLISSVAWVAIRLTIFITLVFLEHASSHAANNQSTTKLDELFIPFIKDLVVVTICLIAFLAILGIVFHVDVLALVTGLGIGGLAIALAARETLENL